MARVLIVEDEPLISMMLEDWLIELGHDPVGPVATVQDALSSISAQSPDAAIVDVNLRGQRCDPIADDLSIRGVPFAFATGNPTDTVGQIFGSCPTISKPYSFEDIQKAMIFLVGAENKVQL